jgi:hypothetical protein
MMPSGIDGSPGPASRHWHPGLHGDSDILHDCWCSATRRARAVRTELQVGVGREERGVWAGLGLGLQLGGQDGGAMLKGQEQGG